MGRLSTISARILLSVLRLQALLDALVQCFRIHVPRGGYSPAISGAVPDRLAGEDALRGQTLR